MTEGHRTGVSLQYQMEGSCAFNVVFNWLWLHLVGHACHHHTCHGSPVFLFAIEGTSRSRTISSFGNTRLRILLKGVCWVARQAGRLVIFALVLVLGIVHLECDVSVRTAGHLWVFRREMIEDTQQS